MEKSVLKNFGIFTKEPPFKAATLLKIRLWHRGFLVGFARFLRTPFLQNTSEWSSWLYTLELYIAGNFQVIKSQ